jgi:type II secretory pathway pseudopilin PulG
MKKSPRTILGVTLLEIMLVLAIAAMVIVMSIRYYQSASDNQKINSALNTITGIVAAGESYLASGPASGMSGISNAVLQSQVGYTVPPSPWGGSITVAGSGNTTYSISMPVSSSGSVCTRMIALLAQNSKFTNTSCASGALSLTVNE